MDKEIIHKESFIQIEGWMIKELGLTNNDLMVFAIIFGFNKRGKNWFQGSREYLATWCTCSTSGIDKNLKNLLERGLIIKDNQRTSKYCCRYRCNKTIYEKYRDTVKPKKKGAEEKEEKEETYQTYVPGQLYKPCSPPEPTKAIRYY